MFIRDDYPVSPSITDKISAIVSGHEPINSISPYTGDIPTTSIRPRPAAQHYPLDHEFTRISKMTFTPNEKSIYEKTAYDIYTWLESSTASFNTSQKGTVVKVWVKSFHAIQTELGKSMFLAIFEHWYRDKVKATAQALRQSHTLIDNFEFVFE